MNQNTNTMAPKDEKIVNKDDSVTNQEAENNLDNSKQENEPQKDEAERVPTVVPDNDNGEPGPPEEESAVDKGNVKPDKNL